MFFLPSSGGGALRADCAVAVGTPVMILAAGIICWDAERGARPASAWRPRVGARSHRSVSR